MKTNNPKTINEHFDAKYGEKGTRSRNDFEQNAEAFFIATENIKKRK